MASSFDSYRNVIHNLKVGDTVRVKTFDEMDNEFGFDWDEHIPFGMDDRMYDYLGKEFVIKSIRAHSKHKESFILNNPYDPYNEWYWHLSALKFNQDENLI